MQAATFISDITNHCFVCFSFHIGNVSYNLGLVLYQKQIYDSAETLVVMSNNHLLQWCIQGESLLLNKTEKVVAFILYFSLLFGCV